MEALFERGGLPIHHSVNGIPYVFKRNDAGHYVCNVYSGEHREMLIRGGNFRMYNPDQVADADVEETTIADAEETARPKRRRRDAE